MDVEVTHDYVLAVESGGTTPTAGGWNTGACIEYTNPAPFGKEGAICEAVGTPGTRTTFGCVA